MKDLNPYLPESAVIEGFRSETSDTKTFKVVPEDKKSKLFDYMPGQFMEVSLPGVGECPISITSSPTKKGFIEFCIKNLGKVTSVIHDLGEGDEVWVRGPCGNSFLDKGLKGKDVVFVAGGIGLAPLRSVINYLLDNRKDYGKIFILYGARNPSEIIFPD
ncbi:FAD-binding oxidoreductase, partial [Candidatus Altiarchaeota archaeon]